MNVYSHTYKLRMNRERPPFTRRKAVDCNAKGRRLNTHPCPPEGRELGMPTTFGIFLGNDLKMICNYLIIRQLIKGPHSRCERRPFTLPFAAFCFAKGHLLNTHPYPPYGRKHGKHSLLRPRRTRIIGLIWFIRPILQYPTCGNRPVLCFFMTLKLAFSHKTIRFVAGNITNPHKV